MTATTGLAIELIDSQQEQHEVTANEGSNILDAAVAGEVTINLTADANFSILTTGTPAQWQYQQIRIGDTGAVLTAARDIIWPAVSRRGPFTVLNATAWPLTIKRTGQSGVQIPVGGRYVLHDSGTDIRFHSVPPEELLGNRIINGDMRIDQRNAGAALTPADSTATYTIDRMRFMKVTAGTVTVQRDTDVPAGYGFVNSLKLTVGTNDASVAAGDYVVIGQHVEGSAIPDFLLGLASARKIVFSFWAKSSVTGTYGVSLRNSAGNRSYVATFSIPVANVWKPYNIALTGDLTGTWLTTTGIGVQVNICLMAGTTSHGTALAWAASGAFSTSAQVNWMATNANTFFTTGWQLKLGGTMTQFLPENLGDSLLKCQRYYQKSFIQETAPVQNAGVDTGEQNAVAAVAGAAVLRIFTNFSTIMRASPTVTLFNPAAANAQVRDRNVPGDCTDSVGEKITDRGFSVYAVGNAGTAAGNLIGVHWTASSEI